MPDTLPGRSETIELRPLSQGEIEGSPDGFIDAAFVAGTDLVNEPGPEPPSKRDYLARVARGGYPEAVRRETPRRRQRFFDSYLADILSRDIRQVADIERTGAMRRLVSLLAGQACGLLNPNRLAADSVVGGLVENFVLGELGRQLSWSQTTARLHHYRDRDQYEVDAVLEDNAGRIVAVEVKAAATGRDGDFRGLRRLERRLGDRFVAGFVLYCGPQRLRFGDRHACLPISALWTTPAIPSGP